MPMKDILHRLQPVQLYIVLILSIAYFLVQLFLSHITHALTLLVDSYHMLCNIMALTGCILTIKYSRKRRENATPVLKITKTSQTDKFTDISLQDQQKQNQMKQHEQSLRNTFGWTRIDVLTMLIVCVFLASLCFSLLVEAVQTLIHIGHQDTIHLPIPILITGCFGFVLNGICYLLIGGYTFHQGSFLHITSSGDVVLDRLETGDSVKLGERRLTKNKIHSNIEEPKREQHFLECFRDISSTIFVVICSIIVYFANDESVSKFIDPLISIVSCILLLVLSYPYMKEACLILLQTIPGSIDIESFKQNLLKSFSDIVSVHDLHIWQLTGNKYVSTAHIIFQNPTVYGQIMKDVINYFHQQGIQIVTIQPEFHTDPTISMCMVKCTQNSCISKGCCPEHKEKELNEVMILETSVNSTPQISNENLKTDEEQIPNVLGVQTMTAELTQSCLSLNATSNQDDEKLPSLQERSVSETNIGEIQNRPVSDLGTEFENKINVEMYNIDQVGQNAGAGVEIVKTE